MRFYFVGERPSQLAVTIGASWQNGRLAAKQLHDALRACGLDPADHQYTNLYTRPDTGSWDDEDQQAALIRIQGAAAEGLTIIGMGAIVCRVLRCAAIPHRQLIHPAARGAIRKKERYYAHVAAILIT